MLVELLWRYHEVWLRGRKIAKMGKPASVNPWYEKGDEFSAVAWAEGHAAGVAHLIAMIPLTRAYEAGMAAGKAVQAMDTNPYDKTNNLDEYVKWNEGWIKQVLRGGLKPRLYDAQRGICYLCGTMIMGTNTATFDHVVSRDKGGDDIDNLLLAHYSCNSRKTNRDPYACELMYLDFINEVIS